MNGISKCLLVAQLLVLAHWLHRIAGVDDNSLTTTATTVEITHNNNNNSRIDGSSEFNFLVAFLIQFNPYCVSAFTGALTWLYLTNLKYYNQMNLFTNMKVSPLSRLRPSDAFTIFQQVPMLLGLLVSALTYRTCVYT